MRERDSEGQKQRTIVKGKKKKTEPAYTKGGSTLSEHSSNE